MRVLGAIALLLCAGCSEDPPPVTGPGLEAPDLPPAMRAGLERAIQKQLEVFRNAPGRTGC
jgi:hypothetical protein